MANYTTSTRIDTRRFVPITSRYADMPVIYYTENKILTFPIYKKEKEKIKPGDKYYIVTSGTEYRPDLVSHTAYGTVDLWWKIMEANNIKDVFDFKAGLNIKIPDALFG